MAKLVIAVLLSMTFYGCDLAANLVIKNRSGSPAHVRLVQDRDGTTSEHIMALADQGPGSQAYVGFGFWSCFRGRTLDENVAQFRRIDIVSLNDSVSYSGPTLRTMFIEGRKPGLFGCTCTYKVR